MQRKRQGICGLWLAVVTATLNAWAFAGQPASPSEPSPNPSTCEPAPNADSPHVKLPTAPPASAPAAQDAELDPLQIFNKVADRYHRLLTYKDSVRLVQTTQREGEAASSVETNLTCEIADGKLHVETAAAVIRNALGIGLPFKETPATEQLLQRYNLWLAPHMAMKFADKPLQEFRAGVDEGFTATGAESVTIDDKKMLHLALKSGDGLSRDCSARFDLFINPESMLIERIDGEQRLPDGANYQTTLHITPLSVENDDAQPQPTT